MNSLTVFQKRSGRRGLRFSLLFGAACLTALGLSATRLHAQTTGVVTGTVINPNTHRFLENAEVRVQGTNLSALTDADGSYRIAGVPAGAHQLNVIYTGLDETIANVDVTAGGTARADFQLKSDVYKMGEFVVATEREGNAAAINQQKRADSFQTIASADAFGDITYGNPGDFLKYMPGIQMDSMADPRTISVRGMDSSLTVVSMDGNQLATAASSTTSRSFEIDQIAIGNIETVEVYKTPLPSMPANSIGGTVNFVTKSAFEQKGRRVRLTLGLNADAYELDFRKTPGPNESGSRKILPKGALSFSDSFFNNRLGVAINASKSKTWFPGYQADNSFTYVAPLPVTPIPYSKDLPRARRGVYGAFTNQQYIERNGLSANFDFKLNDNIVLFLRNSYTDYFTMNRSLTFRLRANAVDPNFTVTDVTALPTTSVAEFTTSFHEKFSKSWAFNPGLRFRAADWRIDLNGGFSKATNHYNYPDFFNVVNMQLAGVGFRMITPEGTTVPSSLTQTAGPDFYNVANYKPQSPFMTNNERNAKDVIYSGQASARRSFTTRFPFYVEVGGSYQRDERARNQPQRRWSYVGPDGIAGTADDTTNMGQFANTNGVTFSLGQTTPLIVSPWKVYDVFASTPKAFVEDLPFAYEQQFLQRLKLNETIYAGYAMGKVSFGRLDVLLGLRSESTEVEATGPRKQESKVPAGVSLTSLEGMIAKYSRTKATTSYTPDPFKYLHLAYRVSSNLQARASYSESMGRPEFASIFPTMTVNDTARTVAINNTELKPQFSNNYDVSLEYYFKSAGQFTAAWFKKDIRDYISTNSFTITTADPDLGIGPELVGYQLNTQNNLGKAKLEGIELDYRQQLGRFPFVPRVLQGIEVFGNFTQTYKLEGDFGGTRYIKQLATVSPRLYNAGLSYRTPGGKFFAQMKVSYRSAYLLANTDLAERLKQQRNAVIKYDAELRYRLTNRYELSLTGRNLFNALDIQSEVDRVTRRIGDIGAWYSLAVNIDL